MSVPAPSRPSRLPKLSGFASGVLGGLGCLACITLGTAIGFFIGNATDRGFIQVGWLIGSIGGAIVGLICGVTILATFYRNDRKRS